MGVIESELRQANRIKMGSLWGNNPLAFKACESSETNSGGIFMVWNTYTHYVINVNKGDRWIIAKDSLTSLNWQCSIGLVYDGNSFEHKNLIYSEIQQKLLCYPPQYF